MMKIFTKEPIMKSTRIYFGDANVAYEEITLQPGTEIPLEQFLYYMAYGCRGVSLDARPIVRAILERLEKGQDFHTIQASYNRFDIVFRICRMMDERFTFTL